MPGSQFPNVNWSREGSTWHWGSNWRHSGWRKSRNHSSMATQTPVITYFHL